MSEQTPEPNQPWENDYAHVYKDEAGEWRFVVKAGNHRTIASSEEGFTTKSNALRSLKREHPHIQYVTERETDRKIELWPDSDEVGS